MNYDLCDILNKKMEAIFAYLPENLTKSRYRDQKFLDNHLHNNYENFYLELLDSENNNESYGIWVYRNGKFSDQIVDFESASKKISREIANMTFSTNPSLDIMYYSGAIKMIFSNDKAIYLETCTKPSLDQIMSIKDFEKNILKNNGKLIWRVVEKRGRYLYQDGHDLSNLFSYNWSRIK